MTTAPKAAGMKGKASGKLDPIAAGEQGTGLQTRGSISSRLV
jgi:hypothetical protein